MKTVRLDAYLADQKIVESRNLAQRLIMAGKVEVNGQLATKPSQKIKTEDKVTLREGPKFVSRGGEKLEPALVTFGFDDLNDYVCVDVGASTGGFTDCLLQHGAQKVYTVDVGYGILHWKLRNDPKVIVMERTNARFVENFTEKIDLVTVDASFISLKVLLPTIRDWFENVGDVVALIKPQFEAGRADAAKGAGVIREPEIHRKVLLETLSFALDQKFSIMGLTRSSLVGPKGNIEFLAHLHFPAETRTDHESIVEMINQVLGESEAGLAEQPYIE